MYQVPWGSVPVSGAAVDAVTWSKFAPEERGVRSFSGGQCREQCNAVVKMRVVAGKKDTGETRCANWIFEVTARAVGAVASFGRILPVYCPAFECPANR